VTLNRLSAPTPYRRRKPHGNIEGLMQDIIKTTTALEPAIVVLM
jgi:hypothetical protein